VQQNDKLVLVYATFPSAETAEAAGGRLVELGLAACVNILPAMTSIYVWQGQRHREAEAAMIIKTRAALAEAVIAEGRKLHPYENPAFLVLPVAGGAAEFVAWVEAQTARKIAD
jgi:periplasmic divalent cation tolerance protein